MDVKINVKVTVGKDSTFRNIEMEWWDEMEIEDIANDIKDAVLNIE